MESTPKTIKCKYYVQKKIGYKAKKYNTLRLVIDRKKRKRAVKYQCFIFNKNLTFKISTLV